MKRLHTLFFLLSVASLVFSVVLLVVESNPPWKPYQRQYIDYMKSQDRGETVPRRKMTFGIRQDWNPELDVTDRCRTCHLGVANDRAPATAPLHPHPDISPHRFSRLGCTTCHRGDGYATRLPDAHENMLPLNLTEGSCGQCHGREIDSMAPTLKRGDRLVDRYSCEGCHQLEKEPNLSTPGPVLSNVGGKVFRKWLRRWLDHPKGYDRNANMPDFLLTGAAIDSLADYLLDVKEPHSLRDYLSSANGTTSVDIESLDEDARDERLENGRKTFATLRCLSCHTLGGRGGDLAPELGRIAQKTGRQWMRAWIDDPHRWDDRTIMPAFNLTDDESVNIVEYLLDESEEEEEHEGAEENRKESQSTTADDLAAGRVRGRNLFTSKGCQNCHAMSGVEKTGNFASSLADMANVDVSQLGFGNSNIPRTKSDYIAAKLQNPRLFGKELLMPFFDLPPKEVGRITLALMGRSRNIPEPYRVPPKIKDHHLPKGQVGELFERYRCLSCHRVREVGADLAPDLTAEGSKVQRNWLKSFLKVPYAVRPYLTERMPRFNLTDQEAGLLADYIELALREESIDWSDTPKGPGRGNRGKTLYFDGYRCQSCHSIGAGGGYYGAALDKSGERLERRWMIARMENVHRYESGAREPALNIKQDHANDIAAFLRTLGGKREEE